MGFQEHTNQMVKIGYDNNYYLLRDMSRQDQFCCFYLFEAFVCLFIGLIVCLFVCLFMVYLGCAVLVCRWRRVLADDVVIGRRWLLQTITSFAPPEKSPLISWFFCQGRSLHPLLSILSNVFLLQMFLQEGFFPAQIFTKPAVTVLCRLFVWPFFLFICLFDI